MDKKYIQCKDRLENAYLQKKVLKEHMEFVFTDLFNQTYKAVPELLEYVDAMVARIEKITEEL
jgi:hypothetical protein